MQASHETSNFDSKTLFPMCASVHAPEAHGDVCVHEQQDGGGRGGGRAAGQVQDRDQPWRLRSLPCQVTWGLGISTVQRVAP